jgi:hypothetical protein
LPTRKRYRNVRRLASETAQQLAVWTRWRQTARVRPLLCPRPGTKPEDRGPRGKRRGLDCRRAGCVGRQSARPSGSSRSGGAGCWPHANSQASLADRARRKRQWLSVQRDSAGSSIGRAQCSASYQMEPAPQTRGRGRSCPKAAVRAVPARLLLLCLLLRSSWLTVEGGRQIGAAGVLHRRGGRAAVAVSVGMAVAFQSGSDSRRGAVARGCWIFVRAAVTPLAPSVAGTAQMRSCRPDCRSAPAAPTSSTAPHVIAMTAERQRADRARAPLLLVHLSSLEVNQQRVCFVRVAVVGDDRPWTVRSTACPGGRSGSLARGGTVNAR